jgi:SulP family sulfate permease
VGPGQPGPRRPGVVRGVPVQAFQRFKQFINPLDQRFEDLGRGDWRLNVLRDFTAGLVVAMVAIPLAMGFAMASGLRPEQGIVGGAVAGLVGALWGGSKYQVYGPTAAFIPLIAGIMAAHSHGYLVLVSVLAGLVLWVLGLLGAGRHVQAVPHSIIVGFTIGIAVTIALSQAGEVFGLQVTLGYKFIPKIQGILENIGQLKLWAVVLAFGTLLLTKTLLKVSVFLPAPLIALGVGAWLAQGPLGGAGLALIRTKYGSIPAKSWSFTPPTLEISWQDVPGILYAVTAIVFVAAVESLLCSRMADRLAGNTRFPYNPDRELFGQGLVMALVPLFNGFPHTGALARTATNIKLGAISPMAGVFKAGLKLLIAFYLASYLEMVPMACIGGILMYVAWNMVKGEEITEVFHMGRGHTALMVYTALAVTVTDFLTGVLSSLVMYAVWQGVERKRTSMVAAAREAATRADVLAGGQRVRAVLGNNDAAARRPQHELPATEVRKWAGHIRAVPHIPATAFVHPQASVIGRVILGSHVHIAAGASVRADEGSPFFVGANSNIQDGVVIHALKDKHVLVGGEPWAVYVGRNVSMAHQALVHGPCFVGDDCFIGFKANIHDCVIGTGSYVGIGATVVGVHIPDGRFVPHGGVVDSQAKADALAKATHAHHEFNEDVVEVNRGLSVAYQHGGLPEAGSSGAVIASTITIMPNGAAGWVPPRPARDADRF